MNQLFKKRKEQISIVQQFFNRVVKTEVKVVEASQIVICDGCKQAIAPESIKANQGVCIHCGYHMRMGAYDRLSLLLDEGTFREIDKKRTSFHVNDFPGYKKKLYQYQQAANVNEAVVCGSGQISGMKVAIAVMDSYFMMGSMGSVVGDKITKTIEMATQKKFPLLIVSSSGGARMQEGILSLMQMAKTSAALARLDEAGGLYISILTHPTTGGVSASYAMLGDIILAEPKATIGFAGRRVIEKTINEKLPDHFQTSEFLKEKGFVDQVVTRHQLKDTCAKLLQLHQGVNL